MKNNKDYKKDFYSDRGNVNNYEKLRFSNAGGQFVHQTEECLFKIFLSRCDFSGAVLDIPCGAGRLINALNSLGFSNVFAADYSDEMLEKCRSTWSSCEIDICKQDIYNIAYGSSMFSAILSSRFFFHSNDQERLFYEFNRILVPGGYLVFDTLNWSPRTMTKFCSKTLGGDIYTNTYESVSALAHKNGFVVVESESVFMFPSFIYNFIPGFMVGLLKWLESKWPDKWKTKRVWLLRKYE